MTKQHFIFKPLRYCVFVLLCFFLLPVMLFAQNTAKLVTPNPTESAVKLYTFLQEQYKKKIISGVMTGPLNELLIGGSNPRPLSNVKEVAYVLSVTEKIPALVGFDFMNSTGKTSNANYSKAVVAVATELWEKGGIPAFCWHWRNPLLNDTGFYTPENGNSPVANFDLKTAFTNSSCTEWDENSDTYIALIRDIDIVSNMFKELQDKGVAALWRPLHEASGGWFWWGRNKSQSSSAVACKALYQLMFDRMVNHHGLHNLIWIWTSENTTADFNNWYPGDAYVDMIGRDFYDKDNVNHNNSYVTQFNGLQKAYPDKMIALSENGSIPYPTKMLTDGAYWSYFMSWYGKYTIPTVGSIQYNTADEWKTIMSDPYVITLEDMPGWKNVGLEENRAVQAAVYPSKVKDAVYIVCPDYRYSITVTDVGGRLLSFVPTVNGNHTIFCNSWDSGVYYLSVITENGKRTFPVVK